MKTTSELTAKERRVVVGHILVFRTTAKLCRFYRQHEVAAQLDEMADGLKVAI